MQTKQSILKKTMQVGGSTLVSRLLGIVREFLMVRYLGVSALSDAFFTAFKIPNLLRKIFAEGALSAAFVPTLVQTVKKEGKEKANSLITLGFLIFESIVLLLCALTIWQASTIIYYIAPGLSEQQIADAAKFLQILMPFLFFLSSGALLTGALHAAQHFFIPAFSPVFLNIVFIIGIIICLLFKLPVISLCWFIVFGGFLQFLAHLTTYFYLQFGFGNITKENSKKFGSILIKFFWCLLSMSVMEISLIIDTSFASYLPKGSITLIYYANRFMSIPLGIFVTALSTVLLPHFSHISSYAPKRLSFYLLEATKFIFWVTMPTMLLMILFSKKIFLTLFLSEKFTIDQVQEASVILISFVSGLFFFSMNRILVNVYYALHVTWIPGIIAVISTGLNVLLNWLLMPHFQAVGLAMATVISTVLQMTLLFAVLYYHFNFTFYMHNFLIVAYHHVLQVILLFSVFLLLYRFISLFIMNTPFAYLFLETLCFWFWVTPLVCLFGLSLWYSTKQFKLNLFFLKR